MDYTSALAELLALHGFRRFTMSRTQVGHLKLVGELEGRPIDIVVDTGAGKTFVELGYCRSEGIHVIDTGLAGAPAAGAGSSTASNVYTLGDVRLTLEGMQIRSDGIFAIDMSHTNEKLATRGVEPIRAVIGQDVLRNHEAVIDYATFALFLKDEPAC
jgi:hypothetical protein